MKPTLPFLFLLAFILFASAQPSPSSIVMPAGNIVVNGGFESGMRGWLGTYGYLDPMEMGRPVPALEGIRTGAVIDLGSSSVGQPMWQILPTMAGAKYEFRFSLLSGYGLIGQFPGNSPAPVNVYWGGELFGEGSHYLGVFRNSSTTTWQSYSFEVTAASNSTIIQFVDYTDMHWQLIDAVSVVAVPEPNGAALFLNGFAMIGLYQLLSLFRSKSPQNQ